MMTQADLAERIDVTTETISRIERGRTIPSLSSLQRIAAALGCDLPELFTDGDQTRQRRQELDRLVAALSHRDRDDIDLVVDIARRIFKRFAVVPQRRGRQARRR